MKTLQKTLFFIFVLLLNCEAQVPNQPDCLGLTLSDGNPSYNYVTVFGDGKYGLTAKHYPPAIGAELTFGDGSKTNVKEIITIRGGYHVGEYDLALVTFTTPVAVTPAKVWWYRPSNLWGDQLQIKIFGLDGWVDGTDGLISENTAPEINNGLRYSNTLVREGYSGAPIFFQDNSGNLYLLGLNWGAWYYVGDPPETYRGGVANLVFMVFEQYWDLFPVEFQPPSQPQLAIKTVGDQVEVTLKFPQGKEGLIITSSQDMIAPWSNASWQLGFNGFDQCPGPWEKILKWNPVTAGCSKMFFYFGEYQYPEEAPATANMLSKPAKQKRTEGIIIVPLSP